MNNTTLWKDLVNISLSFDWVLLLLYKERLIKVYYKIFGMIHQAFIFIAILVFGNANPQLSATSLAEGGNLRFSNFTG